MSATAFVTASSSRWPPPGRTARATSGPARWTRSSSSWIRPLGALGTGAQLPAVAHVCSGLAASGTIRHRSARPHGQAAAVGRPASPRAQPGPPRRFDLRALTGAPRKRMTRSAMSSSAAVTSATSRMSLSASSHRPPAGVGRGEGRLETLDALVDHPVAALDDAVGVGQQRRPCGQRDLAPRPRLRARRSRAAGPARDRGARWIRRRRRAATAADGPPRSR